ncbi:MAG: hypothetical protein R6W92_02495 [Desulfocurvibacter africanus]
MAMLRGRRCMEMGMNPPLAVCNSQSGKQWQTADLRLDSPAAEVDPIFHRPPEPAEGMILPQSLTVPRSSLHPGKYTLRRVYAVAGTQEMAAL